MKYFTTIPSLHIHRWCDFPSWTFPSDVLSVLLSVTSHQSLSSTAVSLLHRRSSLFLDSFLPPCPRTVPAPSQSHRYNLTIVRDIQGADTAAADPTAAAMSSQEENDNEQGVNTTATQVRYTLRVRCNACRALVKGFSFQCVLHWGFSFQLVQHCVVRQGKAEYKFECMSAMNARVVLRRGSGDNHEVKKLGSARLEQGCWSGLGLTLATGFWEGFARNILRWATLIDCTVGDCTLAHLTNERCANWIRSHQQKLRLCCSSVSQ